VVPLRTSPWALTIGTFPLTVDKNATILLSTVKETFHGQTG
jgi:hypothetical protein